MPNYEFINDLTGETKLLSFGMEDNKQYIDEDGYRWRRVFCNPQTSIDSLSNIDAFSSRQFVDKTRSKRGNLGEMIDYSEELSQKRSEKLGTKDPVKQKYYESYASKRHGKRHLDERKEKLKELSNKEIVLNLK